MNDDDIEELRRRSERTGAALNFLGALASPESLPSMLGSMSLQQLHQRCEEAAAAVDLMARGVSGPGVDAKAAQRQVKALGNCLGPELTARVQRYAVEVLEALGFKVAPGPEQSPPRR